jgi:hypothetical protein
MVRAVAALDRHRNLLYTLAQLGDTALAGGEEVPAEAGDRQHRQDQTVISAPLMSYLQVSGTSLHAHPPGGRDQRPFARGPLGDSPDVAASMPARRKRSKNQRIR